MGNSIRAASGPVFGRIGIYSLPVLMAQISAYPRCVRYGPR